MRRSTKVGSACTRWRRLPAIAVLAGATPACLRFVTVGYERGDDSGDVDTDSGGWPETLHPPLSDALLDVGSGECEAPQYEPCDGDESASWAQVLGMSCPQDPIVAADFDGHEDAIVAHAGVLGDGTFAPRHGERFVILANGRAADLPLEVHELGQPGCVEPGDLCPSTELDGHDPGDTFPPPITVTPVSDGETCATAPELVGTGDCSNTLHSQWELAGCTYGEGDLPNACTLHDYGELRLTLEVPAKASGLSFDFAFLTVEYPEFATATFNDMFIAWLDSEAWTGNVSFDEQGHPISVRAGFLDYQASEELEGFAIEGHGATRWLTSSVGVQEGEQLSLIFAIFDMNDGIADSFVLLDALRWDCFGKPPLTIPVP